MKPLGLNHCFDNIQQLCPFGFATFSSLLLCFSDLQSESLEYKDF